MMYINMATLTRGGQEKLVRDETEKVWAKGGDYDIAEKSHLAVLGAMRKALRPEYERLIPPNGRILVIGAGRGFDRKILPDSVSDDRITYTDISEKALGHAHEGAKKVVASSFELPFDNNHGD